MVKRSKLVYQISILLAAFCFGLIPIFGQALTNLDVSSFKQTFFMEFFSFLILAPLYLLKLKSKSLKIKDFWFFSGFGISLVLVNLLPLSAIVLGLPIAIVSLFLYTHPVFTLVISKYWFKEKITFKKTFYILSAVIGVIFLLREGLVVRGISSLGIIAALMGGFSMSLWTCYGKAAEIKKYSPFDTLFWSAAFAIILLFIAIFIFPKIFPYPEVSAFGFNFTGQTLGLSLLMALITTVVGHTMFFYGFGGVTATQAAVLALFEPITAVGLGILIFKQTLSTNIILGCLLILASSILISRDSEN